MCCSILSYVLQCAAVCCSVLPCAAVLCSVLCSVLQCVAVGCACVLTCVLRLLTLMLRVSAYFVCYGVASISMLLKIISLFCKRDLQRRLYSAKETYNFEEPANRSHPISKCAFDQYVFVYMYSCTYVLKYNEYNICMHTYVYI